MSAEGTGARGAGARGAGAVVAQTPTTRCPQCRNRVVQTMGGEVHLRTKGPVIVDKDGTCRALCFFCKTSIRLPLLFTG